MNVYRVLPDVNSFQWFFLEGDEQAEYSAKCEEAGAIDSWSPPALKSEVPDRPLSDFMAVNFSGDFVASPEAIEFLLTSTEVQVLALGEPLGPFSLARVLTSVPCLDPDRCEWRGAPRRSTIFRFAFDEGELASVGSALFRFVRFETGDVQCTDAFRDRYLDSGLRGLQFDRLMQVSPG